MTDPANHYTIQELRQRKMNELRKTAKEHGINSYAMGKDELIEVLNLWALPDGGSSQPLSAEAKYKALNKDTNEINSALAKRASEGGGREDSAPAEAPPDARAERLTTREETGRRARVPLGDPRPKMAAPGRAGYHRRWINDVGDRLRAAEDAGYQFVEDDKEVNEAGRGRRVSMTVGTKEDGSPLRAFLMEIRNEFYEADQAVKQVKIDEVDAAMRRGDPHGVQPQDRDKFYVPKEGISVRS